MAHELIKVSPDEDLYFVWSSITEDPIWVANRAQLFKWLNTPRPRERWLEEREIEALLTTTDTTGSSWSRRGCDFTKVDGHIFQQRGWLPRARFAEYAHRLLADENYDPAEFLQPFDKDGKP